MVTGLSKVTCRPSFPTQLSLGGPALFSPRPFLFLPCRGLLLSITARPSPLPAHLPCLPRAPVTVPLPSMCSSCLTAPLLWLQLPSSHLSLPSSLSGAQDSSLETISCLSVSPKMHVVGNAVALRGGPGDSPSWSPASASCPMGGTRTHSRFGAAGDKPSN